MTGIAIFIVAFWAVSAAVCCYLIHASRRRDWVKVLTLILVYLPIAYLGGLFSLGMWPFDFLGGGSEMRMSVNARGYVVSAVQRPGSDFYDSFFEIRRADGQVARVWIDGDDSKWWRPRMVVQGTRTYFVGGFGTIGPRTSFVDAANGELYGGYYRKTYLLDQLEYGDPARFKQRDGS